MCTRLLYPDRGSQRQRLEIERLGYRGIQTSVSYVTQQLDSPRQVAGVTVYNALEGADYTGTVGTLNLEAGQVCRGSCVSIVLWF